jgi:NAD-dependent dihydropyrimidine dehydrogenase PreA subunit
LERKEVALPQMFSQKDSPEGVHSLMTQHVCYKCGSIIQTEKGDFIVTLDRETLKYIKHPNPFKVNSVECHLCENCRFLWFRVYTKWQSRLYRDNHWWAKAWIEFNNITEVFILS